MDELTAEELAAFGIVDLQARLSKAKITDSKEPLGPAAVCFLQTIAKMIIEATERGAAMSTPGASHIPLPTPPRAKKKGAS